MAKKKSGKGTITKLESDSYEYEVLENIAAAEVKQRVDERVGQQGYVRHNIEAEDDGEFTLIFVYRK